jgi:hypothetical protein
LITKCSAASRPNRQRRTANPDEVTVQDMKRALDNPKLGIKVIDVREAGRIRNRPRERRAAAAVERIARSASPNSIRTSSIISTARPACVR